MLIGNHWRIRRNQYC